MNKTTSSHFFDRIQQKARNQCEPPVLIVAFGDSVTQGVMEYNSLDARSTYHFQLQEMLEAFYPTTTFSTINAGVGGSSAEQALERLERDVIRHQPDLVLVAFGLNDSLKGDSGIPSFSNAMRQISQRIQKETEAKILFLTPPLMATRRSFRIHVNHDAVADSIIQTQTNGTLLQYARTIRQLADDERVGLVDIHSEWTRLADSGLDTDLWLCNGLNHPDKRGHRLIALKIFQELAISSSRSVF